MGAAGPSPWSPGDFFAPQARGLLCTLCPHACVLADGDLGLCRVRRRSGEGLETATLSAAVSHRHAVERKPLYHFLPGLVVHTLAPVGCTFSCRYCLNHRLSQVGRSGVSALPVRPVDAAQVVGAAAAAGEGLALSFSEPGLAAELTLALAAEARPRGVPLIWKTNGFLTPRAWDRLAPALDAVNVDLKAADDDAHRRLTGAPLGPVVDGLLRLRGLGPWVEVSTPLVPGLNDSPQQVERMARIVLRVGPETPWHLARFVPDHRMRAAPTLPAVLERAVAVARGVGLRHVYVERALGPSGRETRCGGCDTVVVERPEPWSPGRSHLRRGACPRCGAAVTGRWSKT